MEWIGLKESLDSKISSAPYVSEGEIWWVSLGENIGTEMNGKSDRFSRPVIILRKLAHGFYLVIPLTTKVHTGTWYVNFKQKGVDMSACLHQIRSMDFRRLYSCLGELDLEDFRKVKKGFLNLYK